MKTDDKYKKFFEEYRENIADIAERSCKILQDKDNDIDIRGEVYIINQKAHEIQHTIDAYF